MIIISKFLQEIRRCILPAKATKLYASVCFILFFPLLLKHRYYIQLCIIRQSLYFADLTHIMIEDESLLKRVKNFEAIYFWKFGVLYRILYRMFVLQDIVY